MTSDQTTDDQFQDDCVRADGAVSTGMATTLCL